MKNPTKEFYTFLVERIENDEPFFQSFWVFGHHMGEAIDTILAFAEQMDVQKLRITQADLFEFDELPDDVCRENESGVYYLNTRFYFPYKEYSNFQLPYGVVLSCIEGELDIGDINEGYTTYVDNNKIRHLEVVVDRTNIYSLFLKLIGELPSIRVFWIRFANDWEVEGKSEFYTNENLNNLSDIKSFIDSNYDNLVLNGYLTLTVYCSEGSINLNLDTHKKIHISTESKKFITMIGNKLKVEGYNYIKYDDFTNVEFGYYHWHYRSPKSKSRDELIEFLKQNGFILWRTE